MFNRRIAIGGRPGVGKSTVVERVLDALPATAGGMLTKEIRKCGYRVGFSVIDIATAETGTLAHLHQRTGPRVGKYRVNLDDLERIGVAAIRSALSQKNLVIVDEIAPMELCSPAFVEAIEETLRAKDVNLLFTTHFRTSHPLAYRVRQEFIRFRVTLSNRETIAKEILATLEEG